MDVKVRPKSTNVELQGVCPLPNTDSGKVAPWQTAEEQNATKQVADELESKVPEIYNLILEGERTGKPLLDLQSLADVDPNSFRNSVWAYKMEKSGDTYNIAKGCYTYHKFMHNSIAFYLW